MKFGLGLEGSCESITRDVDLIRVLRIPKPHRSLPTRISSMANVSRIHRELMQFNKDQSILGMTLMPDDQDVRHLTATIPGPTSTPYDGGIFHLDITLPGSSSLSISISSYA